MPLIDPKEVTLPSGLKVQIGLLDENDPEMVRQWEELKRDPLSTLESYLEAGGKPEDW